MYFICVFKIDPMEELFQGTYYGAKILVRKQVEINMTQKFTASDIRTSTLQTVRQLRLYLKY
jgi:hypothetical protein